MTALHDGDIINVDGHKFRVDFPYDDTQEAPWEREDGHGVVSDWTRRAKAPGEMILCTDHGSHRYYDFAATVKLAKRDGWDAAPYGGTPGEKAHRAALADYDRLRRWCNDHWQYVGVVVELLDDDGDATGETDSLWGLESDAGEYFAEVAEECAGEILHRLESSINRGVRVA